MSALIRRMYAAVEMPVSLGSGNGEVSVWSPTCDCAASIATLPAVPTQDQVGPYPCEGCPSSGGSQQASQT